MQYAIVTGTPIDGIRIYGPFKTEKEALDLYVELGTPHDCWVVPMETGENFKHDFS